MPHTSLHKSVAPTEIPDQLTVENLSLLHDTLTKALAHKFQELGVQLDLELSQIQALSYRRVDMSDHLHKMLERWMSEGQWSSDERAEPLRCICEALESDCVRQRRLAGELREKWKDCYCEVHVVSGVVTVLNSVSFCSGYYGHIKRAFEYTIIIGMSPCCVFVSFMIRYYY